MTITYLQHSGFLVELEKHILLFDWWKGDLPEMDPEKKLLVFVSHGHEDHYSERIWSLKERFDTSYILFEDVAPEKSECGISNMDENRVTDACDDVLKQEGSLEPKRISGQKFTLLRVVPHQNYEVAGTHIETLLSTDQGVAFLIEAEGKMIYHAGDLNVWYWDDEPEEDNRWQVETYHAEMERLKECLAGREIDVAFVPLDPRLGPHAPDAVLAFLQAVDCKELYPMHYWEQDEKIRGYLGQEEFVPYLGKIRF